MKILTQEKMVPVNDRSIFAALKFLDQIQPGGGTNIYHALVKASVVLSQQKSNQRHLFKNYFQVKTFHFFQICFRKFFFFF